MEMPRLGGERNAWKYFIIWRVDYVPKFSNSDEEQHDDDTRGIYNDFDSDKSCLMEDKKEAVDHPHVSNLHHDDNGGDTEIALTVHHAILEADDQHCILYNALTFDHELFYIQSKAGVQITC